MAVYVDNYFNTLALNSMDTLHIRVFNNTQQEHTELFSQHQLSILSSTF